MDRPLDVAIFIRAFEGGGAQRDAILLANALSRLGVSVAIVTLQPEGPFAPLVGPEAEVTQWRFRRLVRPDVEVVPLRPLKLRDAFTTLRDVLLARLPRAVLASEAAPNVL